VKIIVIGGGPAGIMAAIRASQLNQDVTLLEKNSSLGKKLLLSGKGRCNLTNNCGLDLFLKRFSQNGQFLRDAFKKFFNQDLIDFFESRGLKLKVERQLRVFPVTDQSINILEVLIKELAKNKVNIIFKTQVRDLALSDNKIKGVKVNQGDLIPAEKVILALGGASYATTGSTGDGFEIAKRLGHSVIHLRPGLIPLETDRRYPVILEGLALKNIKLNFYSVNKKITSEIGEMVFTDFGISGPLVLTLSGKIADWLQDKKPVYVEIDLKPALTKEQLNARFLREFKLNPKKSIKNALKSFLPQRLINVFIEITKIAPDKKTSQVTAKEREAIVSLLKAFRLNILRTRPLNDAMVTRGGISLKEINPRTMESRLIKGLYFAGEIMDIDADTGGFNLQAAFSTGYLAGESASTL